MYYVEAFNLQSLRGETEKSDTGTYPTPRFNVSSERRPQAHTICFEARITPRVLWLQSNSQTHETNEGLNYNICSKQI